MDKPVTKAVLETGIVDEASLKQLRKWGMLDDDAQPLDFDGQSSEAIVERIREAVESGDAVQIRDTDLDAARQFLGSRQKGKLHLPSPEDDEKTVPLTVEFCILKLGEYLLPWSSEGVQTLLTNRRTYLKPVGKPRVYFEDVRELFFGDKKAFVVCTPRG